MELYGNYYGKGNKAELGRQYMNFSFAEAILREDLDMNPHSYAHLISDKGAQNIQ
jgi:hypothetical protein